MSDDLLGRIAVEIDDRLRSLWSTVQEAERLRADLRALDGELEVPDESLDPALAEPVAEIAPVAEAAPAGDLAPAAEAAPVADVAPAADVALVAEAAPVADVGPAAELAPPSPPPCVASGPRPPLSPKVMRLMGSPGRRPFRARGAGLARSLR